MSNVEKPALLNLNYHLETVIWEDVPQGTRLNALQVQDLIDNASDEQIARAQSKLKEIESTLNNSILKF